MKDDKLQVDPTNISKTLLEDRVITQQVFTVSQILITVLSFIKLLLYLRVFKEFALIIRLCYNVFYKAFSFSVFFYLFNLLFTFLYIYLGVDIGGFPDLFHGDGNDYMWLSNFISVFLYTYRISIGDLEVPNAAIWETALGTEGMTFMVYFSWVVWMIHQYFLHIVFMNFLIAIISQVYENDLANTLQNEYTQKAEMNLEAEQLLTFIGFMEKYFLYILTGDKKDVVDENLKEWQGYVAQIKQNQKHESERLEKKITSVEEKIEKKIDGKIDSVEKKIDSVKEDIASLLEEIKSIKK